MLRKITVFFKYCSVDPKLKLLFNHRMNVFTGMILNLQPLGCIFHYYGI
jgi:hypothetical protein